MENPEAGVENSRQIETPSATALGLKRAGKGREGVKGQKSLPECLMVAKTAR